jgi:predicted membrane protein
MRNKLSNLIWGLVFIVIGVGIAGDIMDLWQFRLFFPGWWTLFIIIPCLVSIVRTGINVGATTGLIIGVMLLVSRYVSFDFNFWRLIVPAILIIIGLRIMFQGAFRKSITVNPPVHVDGQENFHSSNRKEYSAIFASNKIRITDQFTGTSLNSVFGGISIDLRDAIINSDVEITATAVFGGIDIYVPSGIQVKVNNVPVFGGVSNKTVQTSDPNAYTIYLNSTTMFGGIDIK